MSETMETATKLAIIPRSLVSTILAGDTNDILGKLAEEVTKHKPDISTAKGRDAIRSLAARIAKDKMELIRLGKSMTEEWRKSTKAVNAECNLIEERMDALKDQVRAPLTAFEQREANRVKAHEDALARLQESPAFYATIQPSDDIRARLDFLENFPPRDWHEFAQRAQDVLADEIAKTKALLARCLAHEAEQAELTRLRAEAAERARQDAIRAQQEREARIAAEAAERARREAEEAAERARIAAEQERLRATREAQAALDRAEAERVAAEARAAEVERARLRAIEDAKAEAVRAAADAERRRAIAAERAEREKAEAVAAEQRRAAEAKAAEEAAATKRAANLAHLRKINRAAVAAIIEALSGPEFENLAAEPVAVAVVTAIAKGLVPNVRIEY